MSILTQIPLDKRLHLAAGFIVAVAVCLAHWLVPSVSFTSWLLALTCPQVLLVAVGASALAGAAKEAYDWVYNAYAQAHGLPPPHSVDPWDWVATTLGGVLFAACISIVMFAGWLSC